MKMDDIIAKRLELLEKKNIIVNKEYPPKQQNETQPQPQIQDNQYDLKDSPVDMFSSFEKLEVNEPKPKRTSKISQTQFETFKVKQGPQALIEKIIENLKTVPRHYYDPFYDSEPHIRYLFYTLCALTIIILLTVLVLI